MKDHDTLNKKLWDLETETLKKEVRDHIIRIVMFVKEIVEKDLNRSIVFRDCFLVGSMCGYNYTEKSDLDMHIIVKNDDSVDLLKVLLLYIKSNFNKKYPIKLKGIPIEINFELDNNLTSISNGVYSVRTDRWLQKPVHSNLDVEIDPKSLTDYEDDINNVLKSDDLNDVDSKLSKIYADRQRGLSSDGIFSSGNLIFKKMRDAGKLKALKDKRNELITQSLSLEETLSDILSRKRVSYFKTDDIQNIDSKAELVNIEACLLADLEEIVCAFNYMVEDEYDDVGHAQVLVRKYTFDEFDDFAKDIIQNLKNVSESDVKDFWIQLLDSEHNEVFEILNSN